MKTRVELRTLPPKMPALDAAADLANRIERRDGIHVLRATWNRISAMIEQRLADA